MGYMEGNLSGVDYSYGGAASHYPLWKPPSGYFPRGEAPPPYEEAIAISQAEALSAAQCTVSVGTTTHRAVDMPGELRRSIQGQPQSLPQQSYGGQMVPHQMQNQVNALPPHHQQQNQITQSTTNLINININSGGNVTTIATGENHQPPYSLQTECSSQISHAMQEHQLQQHHHHQSSVVSGRLHLTPNNSICVQTISQQQTQPQQIATATAASNTNTTTASKFQQQQQQQHAFCQSFHETECNYKNCYLSTSSSSGVAQRRLQRQPTPETPQQYASSLADVEMSPGGAGSDYHALPAENYVPSELEFIASPIQFSGNATASHMTSAVSTPSLDVVATPVTCSEISTISRAGISVGHSTLPSSSAQYSNSKNSINCNNDSSSSSSSNNKMLLTAGRRYHRTMPRYLTVSDPLRATGNATANIYKSQTKSIATNTTIVATTASATTIPVGTSTSTSISNSTSKKPTCQCPIQHVPMSYMGTNNLNLNAQQQVSNNIFLSSLSNKINSLGTSSSSSNNLDRSSINYGYKIKPNVPAVIQQSAAEIPAAKRLTHSSPYCSQEPKISTISKQVGDTTAETVSVGHHHHHHHQHQHHRNDDPLVVLSKVPKKSSQEHLKIGVRSESNAGGTFPNKKTDDFVKYPGHQHNEGNDTNPVLPPKLCKSVTNLKSLPATTTASTNHDAELCRSSSPSTTSSPKISLSSKGTPYRHHAAGSTTARNMLSKHETSQIMCPQGPSVEAPLISKAPTNRKEPKNTPPSLTLPPPSPTKTLSIGHAESNAVNKINSSTFYPLHNNHVTYTLPKHTTGKISLNSTIANVVSKVPSVISIPTDNHDTNCPAESKKDMVNKSNSLNKCTTLPKILRTKRVAYQESAAAFQGFDSACQAQSAYAQQQQQRHMNAISRNQNAGGTSANMDIKTKTEKGKHLPVCTTSKNCLNPKEHFLPNDTSLDDDYLSECENCKIAQSSKYYLNTEISDPPPQETMTLQRKSMDDNKEEQEQTYYRISHTLPTNTKKNAPIKNNNHESWFSTIPASSSSEDDVNE